MCVFMLLLICQFLFFKDFIYLFFRERGREGERERNINVWLPLIFPQLGACLATQACALTGNRPGHTLFHKPALNPLSYNSQGLFSYFNERVYVIYFHGDFFQTHGSERTTLKL